MCDQGNRLRNRTPCAGRLRELSRLGPGRRTSSSRSPHRPTAPIDDDGGRRTSGASAVRTGSLRICSTCFGVQPAIGAGITSRDVETNNKVALISDALWRRRFNADPGVVGKPIRFESGVYTVGGVMPRGFTYPIGSTAASKVDLWVPFVPTSRKLFAAGRRNYNRCVIGRLEARHFAGTGARAHGHHPQRARRRNSATGSTIAASQVLPLKDVVVPAQVRSWMLMLLGAVGVVLLVACANVANLLLARTSDRGRELGVRAALGATRWRLVRGLVVESVILALIGTAGGVLLAYWGVDLLRVILPANLPRVWAIAVDLACHRRSPPPVAIATGDHLRPVPALQMSRADVSGALRASSARRDGRARTAARADGLPCRRGRARGGVAGGRRYLHVQLPSPGAHRPRVPI